MARRDFDFLKIPIDFKFSEEIIGLEEEYSKRDSTSSNFNVVFPSLKSCNARADNPFIDGTTICKHCYYKAFAQKMIEIRKSKRKDFIEHQMALRNSPQIFLKELSEFVIDNEDIFNGAEYGIAREYQSIISSLDSDVISQPENLSFTAQIANAIGKSVGAEVKLREYTMDIFISHSSKNVLIVNQLVELIKIATNLKAEKIRCTSVPGYKLEAGSFTDEVLKKEINESKLFIAFITEESMNSTYVLFELGARWAVDLPLIPVVQSSNDFSLFKGPLSNFHGINLSEENEIYQLIGEIGKKLKINLEPISLYNSKVKELAEIINHDH